MAESIRWESDMAIALAAARVQEKPLMLDFFNPGCGACKQMEAVTHPDLGTIRFINDSLIPIRVNVSSQADTAMDYMIKYTPTVIVADGDGKEHYRTIGFLRPQEFIPALLLGIARTHFNNERYRLSLEALDKILANYPQSQVAGEAQLLRNACSKKV